jgi:hypothetical protein
MTTRANAQWRLAARPSGLFKPSDFQWAEEPLRPVGDGDVLVRNVYLSLDPTNRGWANATPTYLPPIPLGEVMRGIALGVVEESRNPAFSPGDLVQGLIGWQRYLIGNGRGLSVVPRVPGLPMTAYLGLFGHIGATAYFGLLDVGHPKAGETLVVSGAAGAVGSLVGQIGKIVGCRVVGIAGGPEKCRWLTETLGFDAAIDYKREPVRPRLRVLCRQGIDVYFDNVGGDILDAALSIINLRARVVICGLISQYTSDEPPPGPRYFGNILVQRARVEGFIVLDYAERFPEAMKALAAWYTQGKIQYRVEVVDGLEQAPAAVNRLFDGSHHGKLIVKVGEEPS